ncbi:MAG: hypothetical protein AAFR61_03650 [Bacteroidota bacterium]
MGVERLEASVTECGIRLGLDWLRASVTECGIRLEPELAESQWYGSRPAGSWWCGVWDPIGD